MLKMSKTFSCGLNNCFFNSIKKKLKGIIFSYGLNNFVGDDFIKQDIYVLIGSKYSHLVLVGSKYFKIFGGQVQRLNICPPSDEFLDKFKFFVSNKFSDYIFLT